MPAPDAGDPAAFPGPLQGEGRCALCGATDGMVALLLMPDGVARLVCPPCSLPPELRRGEQPWEGTLVFRPRPPPPPAWTCSRCGAPTDTLFALHRADGVRPLCRPCLVGLGIMLPQIDAMAPAPDVLPGHLCEWCQDQPAVGFRRLPFGTDEVGLCAGCMADLSLG